MLRMKHVQSRIVILGILCVFSLACLLLASYIREYTGRNVYSFLRWDMFLAWVPVVCALLIECIYWGRWTSRGIRVLIMSLLGLIWLAFYPNSAYLITDMLHPFVHYKPAAGMRFTHDIEFWHHLLVFFSAAWVGIMLGIYSLYILHSLVSRSFGTITSWLFVSVVLALSSVGIYIGRFIRWNSWDLLTMPGIRIQELYQMLLDPVRLHHLSSFSLLIFAISIFSYGCVYCFTFIRK